MPNDSGRTVEPHRHALPGTSIPRRPWFTTAEDDPLPPIHKRYILILIITGYAGLWGYLAIAPMSRTDWLLENMLVIPSLFVLGHWVYRHPLSDTACLAAFAFLSLHAVGAHYTYSMAPTGYWLQDMMQLERNHFDRVAHFVFGLLFQYPFREAFYRHTPAGACMSAFLAFTCVTSAGAVYEIIEWSAAAILSPDTAMAFLGAQGDVFDAQKDSALGIAGAITGLILSHRHFPKV